MAVQNIAGVLNYFFQFDRLRWLRHFNPLYPS